MRNVRRMFVVLAAAGVVAGLCFVAESASKPPVGKDIQWGPYRDGMAFAAKNNLPVMIDIATTWCTWCQKLDKEVYTVPAVITLSQQFVCVKVDGDKEPNVVKQYNVKGYPAIIFTNSKGEEVHRIGGFKKADAFMKDMNTALEKLGGEQKGK